MSRFEYSHVLPLSPGVSVLLLNKPSIVHDTIIATIGSEQPSSHPLFVTLPKPKAAPHVPLFCSNHILTSYVIYY